VSLGPDGVIVGESVGLRGLWVWDSVHVDVGGERVSVDVNEMVSDSPTVCVEKVGETVWVRVPGVPVSVSVRVVLGDKDRDSEPLAVNPGEIVRDQVGVSVMEVERVAEWLTLSTLLGVSVADAPVPEAVSVRLREAVLDMEVGVGLSLCVGTVTVGLGDSVQLCVSEWRRERVAVKVNVRLRVAERVGGVPVVKLTLGWVGVGVSDRVNDRVPDSVSLGEPGDLVMDLVGALIVAVGL